MIERAIFIQIALQMRTCFQKDEHHTSAKVCTGILSANLPLHTRRRNIASWSTFPHNTVWQVRFELSTNYETVTHVETKVRSTLSEIIRDIRKRYASKHDMTISLQQANAR